MQGTVLVGTNRKRHEINDYHRKGKGEAPEPGEPILILKNNYHYGVFNGQVFCTVKSKEPGFTTVLVTLAREDGSHFDVPLDRVSLRGERNPDPTAIVANFGYALTCHKAQGSEWDEVTVLEESVFQDEKWRYTAATRAAKRLIYVPSSRNIRSMKGKSALTRRLLQKARKA